MEAKLESLFRDFEYHARETVNAVQDRAAAQKLSKEAERRIAKMRREFREQFDATVVAHATGAGYEWQDHIAHAHAAGLPQDVIDCIGSARTAMLPEPYALIHAILSKTTTWQPVPDDLQARAAREWGKRGLVEIVVLSGFYQMFAAINQGFDIKHGDHQGVVS